LIGAALHDDCARTVPIAPLQPRLLDLAGAAAYLGVSQWTVRDLEAAGAITRVRLPRGGDREVRKLLYDRVQLDTFVDHAKDRS
jgi:hypothetical protein